MAKYHKYIFTNKSQEMLTPPTYYAVFYDIDKPKTNLYAMNKRIPESLYYNLCDNFKGKQVELRAVDGFLGKYTVVGHRTFQIFNTIDNNYFVICDCIMAKNAQETEKTLLQVDTLTIER